MHVVRHVLLQFILVSSTLLAADFKIGPDTTLDSLATVATNSNYLVIWRDLGTGPNGIMTGIYVSTTGTMGSPFPISNPGAQPLASRIQSSTVAFGLPNSLVVWTDNRTIGAGIRGALVGLDGSISGGSDFLIAPLTSIGSNNPQVAFAGNDFFVAWQDAPQGSSSGTQIYYARVSPSGTPTAAVALPLVSGSSSAAQSLEFLVNGPGSEVLMVYQDAATSPAGTFGSRIADDNTISSPGTTELFKRDILSQGYGAPIAANFDGTKYVVLSSYGVQTDSTVFLTRLGFDGTVQRLGTGFAEVGQGQTGLPEDNFPRAVYDSFTNEYLFLRNIKGSETAYHIFLDRVMTADSTNRDPNPSPIDTATQGILNGAVAAPLNNQYLICWMDGRRLSNQPAGLANIYGVLYDDATITNPTRPFLRAVARGAPLTGVAPLNVQFAGDSSTGVLDSLGWDFGDGTSNSLAVDPPHTYKTNGDYIAVFTVTHAGISMHDFIHIAVGGLLLGGAGGPPQSIGGTTGSLSAFLNPNFLLSQMAVGANFAKSSSDALNFFGFFDPSILPVSALQTSGSLTIGSNTYTFGFDSKGTPKTSATNVHFTINLQSGAFNLDTSADSLQSVLAAAGAGNETDIKPGRTVTLPVSLTYNSTTWQANVTGAYIATEGKTGKFTYQFGSTLAANAVDATDTGYFHIFGASAVESGMAPPAVGTPPPTKPRILRTHAFTVIANCGNGTAPLVIATSGAWTFSIGNYSESIDVSSFTLKSKTYQYLAPKGKIGITEVLYYPPSGRLSVIFKGIPAEGTSASGMALADSVVNRADMAFSVDLANTTGTDYMGSAYVRLVRTKAGATKWKLR